MLKFLSGDLLIYTLQAGSDTEPEEERTSSKETPVSSDHTLSNPASGRQTSLLSTTLKPHTPIRARQTPRGMSSVRRVATPKANPSTSRTPGSTMPRTHSLKTPKTLGSRTPRSPASSLRRRVPLLGAASTLKRRAHSPRKSPGSVLRRYMQSPGQGSKMSQLGSGSRRVHEILGMWPIWAPRIR